MAEAVKKEHVQAADVFLGAVCCFCFGRMRPSLRPQARGLLLAQHRHLLLRILFGWVCRSYRFRESLYSAGLAACVKELASLCNLL